MEGAKDADCGSVGEKNFAVSTFFTTLVFSFGTALSLHFVI